MTGLLTATIQAVATAETVPLDLHVTLPCTPMAAATVRRLVRALAPDCPRLDDVTQIVSELVAASILQRRPREGTVTVDVVIGEHSARATVAQELAPDVARDVAPGEKRLAHTGFGRALAIVHGAADACHHTTVGARVETSAEVKW